VSPVDASKTRRFCVPAASSGCNRTFSSIRPRGGLTKLIGAVADIVWRRNGRAKIALVFIAFALDRCGVGLEQSRIGELLGFRIDARSRECQTGYRRADRGVPAERAQEDWVRANLSNYPPRPADFKADAARDDHARRQAFLEALRVAPDIKLALFVQPDPSTRLDPVRMLPYAAVSILPERPVCTENLIRVDEVKESPKLME
jgi:hypothetical protein